MVVSVYQETKIVKRIFTYDEFQQHDDEVRTRTILGETRALSNTCCCCGSERAAAPTTSAYQRLLQAAKFVMYIVEWVLTCGASMQLRLPQPMWLSGIKLGAVQDGSAEDPPYVLVFARDLSSLDSARFSCIVDRTQLSSSKITNIRPTVRLFHSHFYDGLGL